MATQAVITAPPATVQDANLDANLDVAGSLRSRRRASLIGLGAFVFFYAVLAAIGLILPRLHGFLWNMGGYTVLILAVSVTKHLREFHPSLLPSVLEKDSPLRVRLTQARNALGWTALGTIVLGLLAALGTNCACDDHPVLFIAWASVMLGSCMGFLGVGAYLGLRTDAPKRLTGTASYWPRAPRPISEYKPFHSEHWGRPSDSVSRTIPSEPAR